MAHLLSPDIEDDISDVGSFSRTIPDVPDEEDEEFDVDEPPRATQSDEDDDENEGDDTEMMPMEIELTPKAKQIPFASSINGSLMSSPERSSRNSTLRSNKRAPKPFDRRFSGMLLSSPTPSSTSLSILKPSHSRQSSVTSTITPAHEETDTPQPPWEVVRWTKLKKLTTHLFSESGKRNYGQPTALVVAATIVVGTSKGLALVFNYQQDIQATIGLGTKAVECGSVTSLAISADHSTIATGHASGHIFTWEISRPAKPFLHILPLHNTQLEQRKSDGHITGSAIVHLGFLGTRHTALVSADNRGMAFSHLATRGFGAVARIVRTIRILGRYPVSAAPNEKRRKASSVLGFASLPLGNIEHPIDAFGLTALLTPYLLVIVSTTPVAETQFKVPRPKEIPPHSTLSGCLAWFPTVKLKRPDPNTGEVVSRTKLVYCWSHILTILDVDVEIPDEKDKQPALHFHPHSRWHGEEPIVAVQWLSRSVLGVLTISQRLIILEDRTLRLADSFDLLQKQIYHHDIFSKQLDNVVENLDENDQSLHGVVADAFYMSFRSYKGRIFLLGVYDISIGTLSNWADRLSALLEAGAYIEAIKLAESYYSGDSDKITVGLPEEDEPRHIMVKEKLIELLTASLKYVLGRDIEDSKDGLFEELAETCFSACIAMNDMEFLFEDVYESFEAVSADRIFTQTLEPHILSGKITSVPTEVLKTMVKYYISVDQTSVLENIICHLDASLMDIDEISTLCKIYHLYDGFAHIWNQALQDYVTPLVEFCGIARQIILSVGDESTSYESAEKMFPYLACSLTGKSYPNGNDLDDGDAFDAKASLYDFILSPKIISWPPGSRTMIETVESISNEPSYPYLSLMLRYDAPSFLSVLNEAFEDAFLNGTSNDGSEILNGDNGRRLPTRQTIINILLDVMGDDKFSSEDSIYLDMFISRNLPKFPQFIGLPGHGLDKLLLRLCDYPSEDVADDCQLSIEYLLSYYTPSDVLKLTPQFHKAGFFRVLKSIYKSSKLYAKLLETYFEDTADRQSVLDCIEDCLRPGSDLSARQRQEVFVVIVEHANDLVTINSDRIARILQTYAPNLLRPVVESLEAKSYARFKFLKALFEDDSVIHSTEGKENIHEQFDEEYVRLMCSYEPNRVASYIDLLQSGDLRLNKVLPAIETSGAIDAAIVLLSRDGLLQDSMDRLKKHLRQLQVGLFGLINGLKESPDVENTTEGVEDLLSDIQKYSKLGIWLCQGQTKAAADKPKKKQINNKQILLKEPEKNLTLDEHLWLDLIDAAVQLTTEINSLILTLELPEHTHSLSQHINTNLRGVVQECFTALLNATSRPSIPVADVITAPATQPHPSFLIILGAFLRRAASTSPSLSALRAVLGEIFQAYAFEERILHLAHEFLEKDVFEHVEDAWTLRQTGWRPKGNICERCRKRAWGPGVGSRVWEQWESNMNQEEASRRERRAKVVADREEALAGNGKGKAMKVQAVDASSSAAATAASVISDDDGSGGGSGSGEYNEKERDKLHVNVFPTLKARPLVVFSCRHIWHKDCLEEEIARLHSGIPFDPDLEERFKCPANHAEDDR